MRKKIIEQKFNKAKVYLENKKFLQLEIGTEEYNSVLEKIINDLQNVKGSLKTRSREGARHRKEADRIQSAINAIKYLNNKSRRMINNAVLREDINTAEYFDKQSIRDFLKTFRKD